MAVWNESFRRNMTRVYPKMIRSNSTNFRDFGSSSPTAWNVTVSAGEISVRSFPKEMRPSASQPVTAFTNPQSQLRVHRRRIG